MPLSVGDQLGHYEVLSLLGQGGMGEVYRARDTKLDRFVAIKVLPQVLARDPERLARFEREAKVLASLDHLNIGHIHGIVDSEDLRGLVLALIEGPTLADRIEAGPIPLDEAVAISKQIIEALEYAHDRGVVHRDLKPANVKITPEGVVKVLDFGLAKVLEDEPPASSSLANSPTLTMGHTRAGVILGTAAYMSPEQAVGRAADRRSDIFSFGAVLYEVLTSKRAFLGTTTPDVLEAVVKSDPDWSKLPSPTPTAVVNLLRRCLEKDRKQRLQSIGEARIVLNSTLEDPASSPQSITPAASRRGFLATAAAAVFAFALGSLAFIHFREQPPAPQVMRFQILSLDKVTLGPSLSVSPDGRMLAFPGRGADGQTLLWVRSFDTLAARALTGTETVGNSIFWSPDSRFIGIAANGKLKRVEAAGGPVQTLCDLQGTFRGGAWAPDGTIIFGVGGHSLMRVSEAGGIPTPLTTLDRSNQESHHGYPSFLPDGRHFIYERSSGIDSSGIYLGSLDSKPEQQDRKRLVTAAAPRYAPSPDPQFGYVLFAREGSLMALPFDAKQMEPSGAAVPVAEGLLFAGQPSYAASTSGVLAFRSGAYDRTSTQLLWFDRRGKQIGQIGPPASYTNISLSPDGRLVLADQATQHLWAADVVRGVFSRVNPGDTREYDPAAISPDGRVAFSYMPGGALGDIYLRLANGAGVPEPLVKSVTQKHPDHWSLDGRFLIYDDHTTQKQDLWIVPMSGDSHKPIPFLVTPADETFGQFSPDTKWVAYSSDESGRREVYVQGFVPDRVPAAGVGKWQISTAGGDKPRWRRDGKEMYYIALDGKMMAVPITSTATTFEPGVAIPLFDTHVAGFVPYDVAPDGRFLVNTVLEDPTANSSPITVVLNWTAALKK